VENANPNGGVLRAPTSGAAPDSFGAAYAIAEETSPALGATDATNDISDEPDTADVMDEPTHVLHLPSPRSRIETRPIAALDIMRRLPARADAPGAEASDPKPGAAHDDAMDILGGGEDAPHTEEPPTLPMMPIPLRTYSRPISSGSASRRHEGLLARFGRDAQHRFALGAVEARTQESTLVFAVATAHALVATAAALVAAALSVMAPVGALWALALALIAGGGAGLGFVASQRRAYAQGVLWLLFSELGMLAWALLALGPRPALVALMVGGVAMSLRTRGRTTATCALVGALALYAATLIVTFMGAWRPPIMLGALPAALLDAGCVAAGLTFALAAMASWASRYAKAEALAQASQHEAAFVRRNASAAREHTEADAERLARALGVAVQGRGLPLPAQADGALSPLAETITITAERIATLQRDREDRLRLEGALTGVLHAVERAWLGLSWSWPDPSGTPLDDLVALLRAPRPQDILLDTASRPSDEYAALPTDDEADDTARMAPLTDDDVVWPEPALDGGGADYAELSAPSQPSFPIVEVHRPGAPLALSAADPAIDSFVTLELFDAAGPLSSPIDASSRAFALGSWPSWPDPWADDDPDDSASRHVAPPPIRRRWNEWSSQPGDHTQPEQRNEQAPDDPTRAQE